MALGDKLAFQGDQLGNLVLSIMNNNRLQEEQIRRIKFENLIKKILEDKRRKSIEDKQKTARQQALVTQAGLALAPAGLGLLGDLFAGGAAGTPALGTAASGAGDFFGTGGGEVFQGGFGVGDPANFGAQAFPALA